MKVLKSIKAKVNKTAVRTINKVEAIYNHRAGHYAIKLGSATLVAYASYQLTKSKLVATMITGAYMDVTKATTYKPTYHVVKD